VTASPIPCSRSILVIGNESAAILADAAAAAWRNSRLFLCPIAFWRIIRERPLDGSVIQFRSIRALKGDFVTTGDPSVELRQHGVVLLRDIYPGDSLTRLKDAAARCFQAIMAETPIPERYQFNRYSHSVLLTALLDFGCNSDELMAPLSAPGLDRVFADAMGPAWTCNMEQTWVRKKFAPIRASPSGYRAHSWHQDGALGVCFLPESEPIPPMTELLTCWIPLNGCGRDSPGLEFVRRRQPGLVHFTELDDPALRRRFSPREFWAPKFDFGDSAVFLNDVLHRTHALPEMRHDRLSVEYRIFPA